MQERENGLKGQWKAKKLCISPLDPLIQLMWKNKEPALDRDLGESVSPGQCLILLEQESERNVQIGVFRYYISQCPLNLPIHSS